MSTERENVGFFFLETRKLVWYRFSHTNPEVRGVSRTSSHQHLCLWQFVRHSQASSPLNQLFKITCCTVVKIPPKGTVYPVAILVYDLWGVMQYLGKYQPFSFISRHPVGLKRGITCGEKIEYIGI